MKSIKLIQKGSLPRKILSNKYIRKFLKNLYIILPLPLFFKNKIRLLLFKYKSYEFKEPILTDEIIKKIESFKLKPLISIIMPTYNTDPKWLNMAIESVNLQWYENWELCIADDASTNPDTINFLGKIDNPKIRITYLEKNLNIAGASNQALSLASGDYIALLDHDDELTPDALYEAVKAINKYDPEFIYSDEDLIEPNGIIINAHFKPDFSPDTLLSYNYICHLTVIKRKLIEKVNGFSLNVDGAQDYDLFLRITELTKNIHHVPKVLYHWRKIVGSTSYDISYKSYAVEAGRKALENAMLRRNINAVVTSEKYTTYRVKYQIAGEPLISIIIPFKDQCFLFKKCIISILEKSTYKNYEIIGVSNNSNEKKTFQYMNELSLKDSRIHFHEINIPFNYSKINNIAAKNHSKGKHIILLNNDIEIITPEWIEAMLEFSQRKDVGAVGAKLYYPNETIQHAGVIIGVKGYAGHFAKTSYRSDPGYFSRNSVIQNLSAVTAACMMVKKSVYEEVDGLDEDNLGTALNDVDFCLRIREKGYLNVFTPFCEAYHHESMTRGYEDTPEKKMRFEKEIAYFKMRHKNILDNGDPYYNPNLSLERGDFSIR